MVEKYQNSETLNDFLKFAVESNGDWLLIDKNIGVLVTAPGFSGGYLDVAQRQTARNVSSLVASRLQKQLPLIDESAASWWLSREIGNGINAYPVSSPFSGIRTLVGGTVVHFNADSVHCNGYLNMARKQTYPGNAFEVSILNACAQVNRPVCLLFSGGKDCLSIALGLREAGLQPEDLRLTYVDARSISNAARVKHAEFAARAAGFELEIVTPDGGWWAWGGEDGPANLLGLFSRTLVEPLAPFHCIAPQQSEEVLFDGQNMDAMLSVEMRKPPQEFPKILGSFSRWYVYVFRDVLRNIRYTETFRHSKVTRSTVFRLEKTLKWMYERLGVYSSYQPASVAAMEFSDHIAALQRRLPPGSIDYERDFDAHGLHREVEALLQYGGSRLNEIWFYMYPAMATMLGHGLDTQVHRFPNQGAFSSLWCRDTRIRDAISPKYEVRRFLKSRLGRSYSDAISGWQESAKRLKEKQGEGNYSELKEFHDLLNAKDSAVLDNLTGPQADRLRTDLEKITRIHECRGGAEKDRMERKERFRQGLRFLNLECILRNASVAPDETMAMNQSESR